MDNVIAILDELLYELSLLAGDTLAYFSDLGIFGKTLGLGAAFFYGKVILFFAITLFILWLSFHLVFGW